MTRISAGLLQGLTVVLGIAAGTLLLVEPHFEGRNAHATVFQVYCNDPFLAYVYVGSIPFFVALRRAFGMFGGWRRDGVCSAATAQALRTIRVCAACAGAFVVGAAVVILGWGDREDRPQGIVMCTVATLVAMGVAAAATWLARKVDAAVKR
jgi:hypothetical protein